MEEEDSRCPVCFHVLVFPRQCRAGHLVCAPCLAIMRDLEKPGIPACPVCKLKSWTNNSVWWRHLQKLYPEEVKTRREELGIKLLNSLTPQELRQVIDELAGNSQVLFEGLGTRGLLSVAVYFLEKGDRAYESIVSEVFAGRDEIPQVATFKSRQEGSMAGSLKRVIDIVTRKGSLVPGRFFAMDAGGSIFVLCSATWNNW